MMRRRMYGRSLCQGLGSLSQKHEVLVLFLLSAHCEAI